MNRENSKIAIIGLGYVGLPLAVAFAEKYAVVGFDINQNKGCWCAVWCADKLLKTCLVH